MNVSPLILFIVCAILMAFAYYCMAKVYKTKTGQPLKKLWIVIFGCFSYIMFSLIQIVIPQVITINYSNNEYTHSKQLYLFNYTDAFGVERPISAGSTYIENLTDEVLFLYPVVYGEETSTSGDITDSELIDARTFVEVNHTPSKYFRKPPQSIYIKEKSKTEWHLDLQKNLITEEF